MSTKHGRIRLLGVSTAALPKVLREIRPVLLWAVAVSCSVFAGAEVGPQFKRLPKERVDPKEFGIQDDTITVIPATSFLAVSGTFAGVGTQLSGSMGRSAFFPPTRSNTTRRWTFPPVR